MSSSLLRSGFDYVCSFLSAKASSHFFVAAIPTLTLSLLPHLETDNSSMQVRIFAQVPYIATNSLLMSMPLHVGNVPTNNYSLQNPLEVHDSLGKLPLYFVDGPDAEYRQWFPLRPVSGDIALLFTTYPRQVDASTRPGPRIDLREDQGGLIGSGEAFIPQLATFHANDQLTIHVEWDLSEAAEQVVAAWTLGDGPSTMYEGTMGSLLRSVFAVGPLNNKTSQVSLPSGQVETFGVYWIGDPPFDIEMLTKKLTHLFTGMASFFNDSGAMYKIFIRHSTAPSFGGTAFLRSFIFEYSSGLEITMEDSLSILAHEMVHNWPYLDLCTPFPISSSVSVFSGACDDDRTWFNEGVAVYYSTVLPYRLGIYTTSQFTDMLNANAQAYYTSPLVNISNADATSRAWQTFHAQRLPYYRGFMYLLAVDAQIRAMSNGTRSVDDVVLALLARRQAGRPHGVNDFLGLVSDALGTGGESLTIASYNEMASGSQFVVPPMESPDFVGLSIRREEMPLFELGFAESSVSQGMISGLVPGSRAAEAGLQNGDMVIKSSFYGFTADVMDRWMHIQVRHSGGEEMRVQYWPRAKKTMVQGYQWGLGSVTN